MIRLDKMLSHSGYGSRKEVKSLIRDGYVYVDGQMVTNDDLKVSLDAEVIVFDEQVSFPEKIYIMLNKPKGVITATIDTYNRTVIDLLEPEIRKRVFPVGRLDIDTEGLLLITNDGQLAHKLLSPKKKIAKVYYVKYTGNLPSNYQKLLDSGIKLDDGYICMPATFEKVGDSDGYITIYEGKFHQIKRMFIALGAQVEYLKRVTFGTLVLDESLEVGACRNLTTEEIEDLQKIVVQY